MPNSFTFIPDGVTDCLVQAYTQETCQSDALLPSVVICPGGAYFDLCEREQFPVAQAFLAAGYHVFILKYSLKEDAKDFKPLCQLSATISHIRKHAQEWMAAPDKIAVCGFSAGGHLAASSGTLAMSKEFLQIWKGTNDIYPNAMILGYPVILSNNFAAVRSIGRVSGAEVGTERFRFFGLDQHVSKQTPPTFIWHTAEDKAASVENSLQFASALSKESVPFELHIFPEGPHGMSVCTREVGYDHPYNARWVEWAITWLDKQFNFSK